VIIEGLTTSELIAFIGLILICVAGFGWWLRLIIKERGQEK